MIFESVECRAAVDEAWRDVPSHHVGVEVDAFIVMPNHVHGVLWIVSNDVGAQPVAPEKVEAPPRPRTVTSGSLGAVVRAFKARVTRDLTGAGASSPIWQRNYYEHVIRSERALNRIRQYIIDNPTKWDMDPENPRMRSASYENEFRHELRS
jgi:REP element-mobilizing transposase RayT